jgi:UDP-glucose 4-epimerase
MIFTTSKENRFFKNKKILITGGLGFIGSALAHRLVRSGSHVTIVDAMIPGYGGNQFNINGIQNKVKVKIGDIRDVRIVNKLVSGKDLIFNLAGTLSHIDSKKDPYTDLDINCRSHITLLEACRKHNPEAKIIFSGTRSQYGKPEYLPVDEKHPMNPLDINGIHNMTAENYHLLYNKIYGIPVVSLRLTNTYGPRHQMRHSRQGIISWFIRLIMDGEEVKLFGGGKQIRDCNYIDDVVDAFILSAMSPKSNGQVYNLGGTHASLLKIVKLLMDITGKGSYKTVLFPKRIKKIEIGNYVADFSKIKNDLGWNPKVSIDRGLKNTIEYYEANKRYYW